MILAAVIITTGRDRICPALMGKTIEPSALLALGAEEGRSCTLYQAFNRCLADNAGVCVPTIDPELLGEVSGLALAVGKIAKGGASRMDGSLQSLLHAGHKHLVVGL